MVPATSETYIFQHSLVLVSIGSLELPADWKSLCAQVWKISENRNKTSRNGHSSSQAVRSCKTCFWVVNNTDIRARFQTFICGDAMFLVFWSGCTPNQSQLQVPSDNPRPSQLAPNKGRHWANRSIKVPLLIAVEGCQGRSPDNERVCSAAGPGFGEQESGVVHCFSCSWWLIYCFECLYGYVSVHLIPCQIRFCECRDVAYIIFFPAEMNFSVFGFRRVFPSHPQSSQHFFPASGLAPSGSQRAGSLGGRGRLPGSPSCSNACSCKPSSTSCCHSNSWPPASRGWRRRCSAAGMRSKMILTSNCHFCQFLGFF